MNKKRQTIKYIVADYLAALAAWVMFFIIRKTSIDIYHFNDINDVFSDRNFYLGAIFIPLFWILFYIFTGEYRSVYKKSRLNDLQHTFVESLIGVVIIFFVFLLDDNIATYRGYYLSFFLLLILHFSLTYAPRLILTTITVRKVHKGKIGFQTLVICSNIGRTISLVDSIKRQVISSGNVFAGYITLNGKPNAKIDRRMKFLGGRKDLEKIIEKEHIEEILIILSREDEDEIYDVIYHIQNQEIEIYIPSDRKDLLTGNIKMREIFSVPLVRVSQNLMQPWEFSLKRLFDIIVSIIAIIILVPFYVLTAIIIKSTSKGPVFYRQERIGRNGKPFYMCKFRSMYIDAEKNGPMLSSGDNDPRITPFGHFMRKVRIDETPQFFHVLRGEMSMVGPRPERQYYIDQIVKLAPEYKLLQKIKPGITSWGQVKFGYADKVEEMVERLQYDLLYLENMGMVTDIKILLYTFIIIFQGRGK